MNRKLFYAMALCAMLFVIASEHAIPAEGQATKKSTLRTENPAVKEIFDACTTKPDLAKVKKLVAANPKLVNAKNSAGTPLIHFAAMHSRDLQLHKLVVEFLLAQGADLSALDSLGQTALHYAAMTGRPEIINLFLERKMDVNAKSEQGRTPVTFRSQILSRSGRLAH